MATRSLTGPTTATLHLKAETKRTKLRPPLTPGRDGTSYGVYVKRTERGKATNRYHDVCHKAYCRTCLKGHKLVCKAKLRVPLSGQNSEDYAICVKRV